MPTNHAASFRLAHLSDCHLGPLPAVQRRELLSKRVLGYINWMRNRAKAYVPGTTDALLADLRSQQPDHIAVTGDLVNLGLKAEFENAGRFLATLGAPDRVTAIPGNHDAYVPGALKHFNTHCAPYLSSDTSSADRASPYPILRKRGPLAIIGLSTACASGPFMATGAVDRAQRLQMEAELIAHADLCRIVLIHHPPASNATPWHKRLIGASRLRQIWQRTGADLVLHGHTHLPTRHSIPGPNGPIAVFGVASAAQAVGGHKPPANYTLFDIKKTATGWAILATRRGYNPSTGTIEELEQHSVETTAVDKEPN